MASTVRASSANTEWFSSHCAGLPFEDAVGNFGSRYAIGLLALCNVFFDEDDDDDDDDDEYGFGEHNGGGALESIDDSSKSSS